MHTSIGVLPSPMPVFKVETSRTLIRVLEKPEMHEKGKSKMSTLLLKKDSLMKLKVIGYWATTSAVTLELLAGGVTDLVHGRTSGTAPIKGG
jgi:hypothetical protein